MLQFNICHVELNIKIKQLKRFLNTVYFDYYKKNKDKKRFKRHSELKITDDIFSAKYWIKSRNGLEQRVILDGVVCIDEVKINAITLEGEFFEKEVVDEFIKTFKLLTKKSQRGFLYNEINSVPLKIEKGRIKDYNQMLKDVFNYSINYADSGKEKEFALMT